MNPKLILTLSLFGLAMGLATISLIPSTIEPAFWLVIFLVSAFLIATKCPRRRFLNGLLTGMANSVWITGAHVYFFSRYLVNHAAEADMLKASSNPKMLMTTTGIAVGVISGALIGLLALLAGKVVKKAIPLNNA